MEKGNSWEERRNELLGKLALRAASCPGLYPFREAADFLRVAQDHADGGLEMVCQVLEAMWQRPEEAIQLNAQSLIRRGQGWESSATDKGKKASGR